MEIIKALSAVMESVGGVSKKERNQHQGFNFRGIDAVVNAVSPALRAQGVVVVPRLLSSEYETVTIGKNQTLQGHARVIVEYAFYAKDGSNISATVAAEAMDSGDKATAKAMSVAFRTALLQALCLPTDETDPDATSYERSSTQERAYSKNPANEKSAAPRAAKGGGAALSAAQQKWVVEQVENKFPGETPLVVVGDILGRQIADLNEVTAAEKVVIVSKLSGAN